MAPGFEGIFHTKYLWRIKVVDRYYMNYSDYGHLDREPEEAALATCGPLLLRHFRGAHRSS